MKKETFRYWLCEKSLYDIKFELEYDDYEKIYFDLINEKINHRQIKITEITVDFSKGLQRVLYLYDYYIVVDSNTYSKYSEI